ncbi:MAG TPA: hypothetical protein VK892_12670 [Pyrinomonadaceae bacterium]|nr:hypothetical protein [Pyrinomonadaceae bacterium]
MNCKQGLTKFFAFLVFVIVIGFTAPVDLFSVSPFDYHADHPPARLFQLLFILFIISPPLIVVMLYLIWQELKKRNKMK